MSNFSVLFAGTAGSCPTARRGLPATLVRYGADTLLFDCGEGTQRQLMRADGLADIDALFFTHLHADHWLGLPGLLASFSLRDRTAPLALYGPAGLLRAVGSSRHMFGHLSYELDVHEIDDGDTVTRGELTVHAATVRHPGRAFGYLLAEADKPGRLDAELAQQLGVRFGPDMGRLMRGETVNGVRPEQVVGQPRRGRRVVLSGDCAPTDALAAAARDADVLVHEATFTHDDVARARQTKHSTGRQAAQLAHDAGVHLLALNHLSPKTNPRDLRGEARAVFANTFVADDFDVIDVPLPDRGQPQYQRNR